MKVFVIRVYIKNTVRLIVVDYNPYSELRRMFAKMAFDCATITPVKL